MLRNVFIAGALVSSIGLIFVGGIRAIPNSTGGFVLVSVWDEMLIGLLVCCSFLAFFRTIAAAVVVWGAMLGRIAVGLALAVPTYRFHTVLRFSVVPAICLAVAAWVDYREALRQDRVTGNL